MKEFVAGDFVGYRDAAGNIMGTGFVTQYQNVQGKVRVKLFGASAYKYFSPARLLKVSEVYPEVYEYLTAK